MRSHQVGQVSALSIAAFDCRVSVVIHWGFAGKAPILACCARNAIEWQLPSLPRLKLKRISSKKYRCRSVNYQAVECRLCHNGEAVIVGQDLSAAKFTESLTRRLERIHLCLNGDHPRRC
jgi:hypothetical protein